MYSRFSFLCDGRDSNRAAAHSAVSNQPGATTTTAACGRNREELLGQRPARRECCSRHEADAGSRNPLLLLSPRVPTRRNVYRGSCGSKDFMAFLFCKPWMHGFCTVFARSMLSMSDDVGRCIALQSVPFFASGEQGQAEFCLHFRVGILEQLQKSRHGDGGFACSGYSLRAGGVGLGIEAAFKLLAQLHTGGFFSYNQKISHSRTFYYT